MASDLVGPAEAPAGAPPGCFGCLASLGVPLVLAGIVLGGVAVSRATHGPPNQAKVPGFFALFFGASGLQLLLTGLWARRATTRLRARQAAAPGQPWLWREDWASRSIAASAPGRARQWIFAVLWNLLTWPIAYAVVTRALHTGDKAQLLALLFPAFGVWQLGVAIRSTMRAVRYGTVVLELSDVPGPIGGEIAGTIRVSRALTPEQRVRVSLVCVRRISRTASRGSRSVKEETLWQGQPSVIAPVGQAGGAAIPFVLSIPDDAMPTDDRDPENRVIWRVRASADAPGLDFVASFDVPVFRTGASDPVAGQR